jgi:hypothetical protein
MVPNFQSQGGFRPIFRIYGPDPLMPPDQTPKVLFSTPKKSNLVRFYSQVIVFGSFLLCLATAVSYLIGCFSFKCFEI